MKEKIALIDGDSLIYYEMGKPTLEEALESLDGRLHQMFEQTQATHYAGFLTSGRCFRYAAAKTKPYKGNRKKGDKPIIFPAIKEYLKQHWKFEAIPELEADDLVSIYHNNENTVICSPDKDVLYQNAGIHYNYGKAETIVQDTKGALTFLWKQMLMGDSTDGIQGIPKVGPKTADTWLKDISINDMPTFVLNKYIEKFGYAKGITNFAETFKLIYILKNRDDVMREVGIELYPIFTTYEVKPLNENEWL
jgi:5'-3' exonuclease